MLNGDEGGRMNWISRFVNDYLGNVEGSKELKFWTAVQILSITMGPNIHLDRSTENLKSNMWVFIEHDNKCYRNSSILSHIKAFVDTQFVKFARKILFEIELLKTLSNKTLFINSDDALQFPQHLAAMYGSISRYEYRSMSFEFVINNPFISILHTMPTALEVDELILSRSIVVHERELTKKIANPSVNKYAEGVSKYTLEEISELKGSMLIENFILDKEVYEVATHDPRLWNNVLKLSMILSISERKDLLITKSNIKTAFKIIHDGNYSDV